MCDKIDTSKLRQNNLQLIRDCLLEADTATKQDISSETGLSLATCTVLLNELIENKEVTELAHDLPNGGRPARRVRLNAEFKHLLMLYLEKAECGQKINWRTVNLKNTITSCGELCFDNIDISEVEKAVADIICEDGQIKAIGIGIPGIVLDGRIALCDIKSLIGVNVIDRLERKFKMRVIIGNDMNFIAYGSFKKRRFPPNISVTCIVWSKNDFAGSGSVVNGKILEGFSNFAGEISYLPYHMTREEQLKKLNNPDEFIGVAVQGIVGIAAILNPKLVIITGDVAACHTKSEYIEECKKYLPTEHIPQLEIVEEPREEYFNGLYNAAMEKIIYIRK
ncbi:MAG: ROK family protein [Oscillospiraceae bacterium]